MTVTKRQPIIGTFGDRGTAETVIEQLTATGIETDRIRLFDGSSDAPDSPAARELDFMSNVVLYLSKLFQPHHRAHRLYAEILRDGCSVVVVEVGGDAQAKRVTQVMQRQGRVDLHDQATPR